MAVRFTSSDKNLFPLRNVNDFTQFFKRHLESGEPNLSLLSILLGHIEDALTVSKSYEKEKAKGYYSDSCDSIRLPNTSLERIEALYSKFISFVRGLVDVGTVAKNTSKETKMTEKDQH